VGGPDLSSKTWLEVYDLIETHALARNWCTMFEVSALAKDPVMRWRQQLRALERYAALGGRIAALPALVYCESPVRR
jgi:hypothetical protein